MRKSLLQLTSQTTLWLNLLQSWRWNRVTSILRILEIHRKLGKITYSFFSFFNQRDQEQKIFFMQIWSVSRVAWLFAEFDKWHHLSCHIQLWCCSWWIRPETLKSILTFMHHHSCSRKQSKRKHILMTERTGKFLVSKWASTFVCS